MSEHMRFRFPSFDCMLWTSSLVNCKLQAKKHRPKAQVNVQENVQANGTGKRVNVQET